MRMYDIILKKREGEVLTREEIEFFVNGYTKGEIPDYQVAALLMAIYFQKMTREETAILTMAMAESGHTLDLSKIDGVKVDKHSTGGVGDKTTLVLGPMVAAAGAPVAKMSGRGLGHTGGTIDKLESISGFDVNISNEQFIKNVNSIKLAVVGQSGELAPADKKLYALRDVTGTVDNISLIASSIMSKKIAAGADGIVLDVKTGTGAFMKTLEDSFALAREMVGIGTHVGRKTVAIISDMDQPLGYAIGNAVEVKEAIETLGGAGAKDLLELCLTLGAYMLVISKIALSPEEGRNRLEETIRSGAALKKLKEFIAAQGGKAEMIDHPELLPSAASLIAVKSTKSGFIDRILADQLGLAALLLGAGRETKESPIDHAVGIVLRKKVNEAIYEGEEIAVIHANDLTQVEACSEMIRSAFVIDQKQSPARPLIFGIVTENGEERFTV